MDGCQAKKHCGDASSKDRISILPRNILETILEKLPIHEEVRTSILSPTWRYTWTTLPVLTLDSRLYEFLGRNDHEFVRIVDKTFLLHSSPILEATLSIHNSDHFPDMDQWILFLSRKGIQRFCLANTDESSDYKVTSHIFSCEELTYLELCRCIFNPPSALKSFRNLTEIRLFMVALSNGSFLSFISSCPLLRSLYLLRCTGLDHVELRAKNLNYLRIRCEFKTICFTESTSLTHVAISKHNKVIRHTTGPSMIVAAMSSLPRIEKLELEDYSLKHFSSGGVPRRLPIELKELKELKFFDVDLNDAGDFASVLCLIRSSPNLSGLWIWGDGDELLEAEDISEEEEEDDDDDEEMWNDMEESINLRELKQVEITSVRGIRAEMNLIKFLLMHSPSLDTMVVQFNKLLSETEQLNLAKEMLQFERSSPRAVVVLEDPPLY